MARSHDEQATRWSKTCGADLPSSSTLKEGSDYGLLKKCQNEKMQFFMANRFPLLPGPPLLNLGGKRAKNQNLKI